jgi:hypothetical protein
VLAGEDRLVTLANTLSAYVIPSPTAMRTQQLGQTTRPVRASLWVMRRSFGCAARHSRVGATLMQSSPRTSASCALPPTPMIAPTAAPSVMAKAWPKRGGLHRVPV